MPLFGRKGDTTPASRKNPDAQVPDSVLPPVKAPVQVKIAEDQTYDSRIIMRRDGFDYLDALRDRKGTTANAWTAIGETALLLWGHDEYLEQYAIEIREVLDPIPAFEVRYISAPRRTNRRQEARAYAHARLYYRLTPPPGPENVDPQDDERPVESITRDIALRSVRLFTPDPLPPGQIIYVTVMLDDGASLSHSMKILRSSRERTEYRRYEGVDAVAFWDPPLSPEQHRQWLAYFRKHRWDYS